MACCVSCIAAVPLDTAASSIASALAVRASTEASPNRDPTAPLRASVSATMRTVSESSTARAAFASSASSSRFLVLLRRRTSRAALAPATATRQWSEARRATAVPNFTPPCASQKLPPGATAASKHTAAKVWEEPTPKSSSSSSSSRVIGRQRCKEFKSTSTAWPLSMRVSSFFSAPHKCCFSSREKHKDADDAASSLRPRASLSPPEMSKQCSMNRSTSCIRTSAKLWLKDASAPVTVVPLLRTPRLTSFRADSKASASDDGDKGNGDDGDDDEDVLPAEEAPSEEAIDVNGGDDDGDGAKNPRSLNSSFSTSDRDPAVLPAAAASAAPSSLACFNLACFCCSRRSFWFVLEVPAALEVGAWATEGGPRLVIMRSPLLRPTACKSKADKADKGEDECEDGVMVRVVLPCLLLREDDGGGGWDKDLPEVGGGGNDGDAGLTAGECFCFEPVEGDGDDGAEKVDGEGGFNCRG
mmetsp:Transcript_38616/g.65773  ORF Transcript_38616/g.65773 Transcript_38616/m.65773 type:complete len:472 (+) Transcript_38616:259-1674(+)